jgi:hypothetical protein
MDYRSNDAVRSCSEAYSIDHHCHSEPSAHTGRENPFSLCTDYQPVCNCPCRPRPLFGIARKGGKNQPRPHKLHIVRFRLKPKARSFRCSSSPQQTRFAGLCRGPEAAFGNRGAHVSETVCLWSALTVVCYSRSLSPPGFAANVLLRWLLGPDRSRVRCCRLRAGRGLTCPTCPPIERVAKLAKLPLKPLQRNGLSNFARWLSYLLV